ncbi:hypothetical protein MWU52_08220 [Jannaschia sp. S6380]|uniref:hypothetical protein n=1 Tax=Jannaschia sp. S6380 TaxID=2926408 RepID=UPI001FF2388A|nr:hypothetical protein [Jannaschia sp. S6380]MCK0167528.1 hypothetical protein [Jannaschia sp. S6380]
MQLDRLVARTMSRFAKGGLASLRPRQAPAEATAPLAATGPDRPRGSGSWANEWVGTKAAVERAKSLARPGRKRKSGKAAADSIPEGTIRTKPLMSARGVKLHNWISDRLEAEAPTCTLHACVSLGAFLSADTAHEGHDPLAGLVADLLIVDETGQPIAALIRENVADPSRHLLMLDALLDADLPIIDLPAKPTLSMLWGEIAETLPGA